MVPLGSRDSFEGIPVTSQFSSGLLGPFSNTTIRPQSLWTSLPAALATSDVSLSGTSLFLVLRMLLPASSWGRLRVMGPLGLLGPPVSCLHLDLGGGWAGRQ
jgi:hypothetical protein